MIDTSQHRPTTLEHHFWGADSGQPYCVRVEK
jgi:hypothetical protein